MIKYMIERTDTQEWYCPYIGFRVHTFGKGWDQHYCTWTKDPNSWSVRKWDTKQEAEDHLRFPEDIPFDIRPICTVTEHEFI